MFQILSQVPEMQAFRDEVRRWLEESCPPSMRTPPGDGDDGVWGGTKTPPTDPDAKAVARAHGRARLDGADVAARVRRRRLSTTSRRRFCARRCSASAAARPLKSLGRVDARPGPARVRERGAEARAPAAHRARRGALVPGIQRARGGVGSRRPPHARGARRRRRTSSTGGRSGRRTRTCPTGCSASCARIPTPPSTQGISFLLIDMSTPGISVRPIRLISGASPFCETLFEGVRVPARNLVGALHHGWEVAKAVLEHERTLISAMRDARASEGDTLADDRRARTGRSRDPMTRDRIAAARDRSARQPPHACSAAGSGAVRRRC